MARVQSGVSVRLDDMFDGMSQSMMNPKVWLKKLYVWKSFLSPPLMIQALNNFSCGCLVRREVGAGNDVENCCEEQCN